MTQKDNDSGSSHPLATILLVAITLLLALLVLLLCPSLQFDFGEVVKPPSFIEIRSIIHTNDQGALNYDSKVVLFHNGTKSYLNDDLTATFYRNGDKLPCVIETLNGFKFIKTHHFGVQTIGGTGCREDKWNPSEKIAIDFVDGTFHPGDTITVEIYQKPKNILISRFSKTG
ncbi:MAG: type IV pilin [Methanolinea sp.]|nr:type IV pilin [Methanolinea sp.]